MKNLALAKEGEKVRIMEFQGGRHFSRRLQTMGVCKDMVFNVLLNPGVGPVLIEHEGFRLAIGRGMASRILVEVVKEEEVRKSES